MVFGTDDRLMQTKSITECTPFEHSAIFSTFFKLQFVIKIFVLSIFEWPFYTGFTVFQWTVTDQSPTDLMKILAQKYSATSLRLVGYWSAPSPIGCSTSFNKKLSCHHDIVSPQALKCFASWGIEVVKNRQKHPSRWFWSNNSHYSIFISYHIIYLSISYLGPEHMNLFFWKKGVLCMSLKGNSSKTKRWHWFFIVWSNLYNSTIVHVIASPWFYSANDYQTETPERAGGRTKINSDCDQFQI